MKKRILIVVPILVVLALAIPVANLIIGPPGGVTLLADDGGDAVLRAAATALEGKCVGCHAANAELPFYANIPGAEGMISADVAAGIREVDLVEAFRGAPKTPVNEAVLAKIERVIHDGDMPPMRYLALHWDGALSDDEETAVLKWIGDSRAAHFAAPGTTGDLARSAIRPIPETVPVNSGKVALGEKLFFDVRLSGDDTLSCASCHALDKGGTDQAPVSTGIRGQQGPINSPTVFNSGFFQSQFWDGRAADLAEQADGPVNNPVEMGSNWAQVIEKLSRDAAFVAQYQAVYTGALNDVNLRDAIAEYEKTLVTPGSPFDRWLKGDESALSEKQKAGYERFTAIGCATCHVGEALGGQSFELMGRARPYFKDDGEPKPADLGLYNVTKNEADKYRFKVPTLRNIAITFPYFHDASAADLSTAVRTMAAVQHDIDLSDEDTALIVAFLESLTGTLHGKSL